MEVFPPDDPQSNEVGNRPTVSQIEQLKSWEDSFSSLERVLQAACEKNESRNDLNNCSRESNVQSVPDTVCPISTAEIKRKLETDLVDSIESNKQKLNCMNNMILNTGEVTIQLVDSSNENCDNIPISNLLPIKTDSKTKYDDFTFQISSEKSHSDTKNSIEFIKLDPKPEIKDEILDLNVEKKPDIFPDLNTSSCIKEENTFSSDIKMIVSGEIKNDSGFTDDLSTESKNEFYPQNDPLPYSLKEENGELKSECPLLSEVSNIMPNKLTAEITPSVKDDKLFLCNRTENGELSPEEKKEENDKKEESLDKKIIKEDKFSKKKKFERCNIRDIKLEEELDAVTLSAQKEEQERIRRLQEAQMRALQERLHQIEVEKEALSQLFSQSAGDAPGLFDSNSLSETDVSVEKKVAIKTENDVVLVESSDEDKKAKIQSVLSTAIAAPIEENIIDISSSSSGNESDSEDSDKKDDDIMVLSDEGEVEPETAEDPNNSGAHTNDCFNLPDEEGRVLVNVGHPPEDPDIFLAPQIAKVIKPHQIGGIRFLYDNVVENLERYKSSPGFGCILAHSMGLGKTVQVVSFVDVFLRHTPATLVLCIVPINTIQNWKAEFDMWVPPSNCVDDALVLSGEVRPRDYNIYTLNENFKTMAARASLIAEWRKNGGVLLMGYEMYRMLALRKMPKIPAKKSKKMKKLEMTFEPETNEQIKKYMEEMYEHIVIPGPDLVICDEGHRIKNSLASTSMALKSIKTRRRVVLTGYPLQNNLLEYWCMVDFVRPNYLGTRAEFCNMFERPISNGQCIDSTPRDRQLMRFRSHVLHSLLVGFVQRRGHSVLRAVLPKKEEHVLLIRMTPIQRQLYKCFVKDLLYVQQATNPLKLFAVCCKIWNHPDILYKLLQEKKAQEDIDLDIDIALAANSGVSSANCGIKKRSYQSKSKASQRSLKAPPRNIKAEPNSFNIGSIKSEPMGCDPGNSQQVNELKFDSQDSVKQEYNISNQNSASSQNEYSVQGSQSFQNTYALKSSLNSQFVQSNYDLSFGMQYPANNQNNAQYGSKNNLSQQFNSEASAQSVQSMFSQSSALENQYGQNSQNQFSLGNSQNFTQTDTQIKSPYSSQANVNQNVSNPPQSPSQNSFQSKCQSYSSQSNNCSSYPQQVDLGNQMQNSNQESFSVQPNSNHEASFPQSPISSNQKFTSQQYTQNSLQAYNNSQFSEQSFNNSSRLQFSEQQSSSQFSTQSVANKSKTNYSQVSNQASPMSETSVHQSSSQSPFQPPPTQSQFAHTSQASSLPHQQFSHQTSYSQISQQYDQQQPSPTQSQFSQASSNQSYSHHYSQQSPEFVQPNAHQQFQQQNMQTFSDQQNMESQFHSNEQTYTSGNQDYHTQQTSVQQQYSQQPFSQPFLESGQSYSQQTSQENISSSFGAQHQFSSQFNKFPNKQEQQNFSQTQLTNPENIPFSSQTVQSISQKQDGHSSSDERNTERNSQAYAEQVSGISQISQSDTQSFTEQISNMTSQYTVQQAASLQFPSQIASSSQFTSQTNKQGESFSNLHFAHQRNDSSEQYIQSAHQFDQQASQASQYSQQSEQNAQQSENSQQIDSNSQIFSSQTQSDPIPQLNSQTQKTFTQQITQNPQQSGHNADQYSQQLSSFPSQQNQLTQQFAQLSHSQQYSQHSTESNEQFSQQPSQTSQQYNQASGKSSQIYGLPSVSSAHQYPHQVSHSPQEFNQQSTHTSQQFNQHSQNSPQYNQQSVSSQMFAESVTQPSQTFNQVTQQSSQYDPLTPQSSQFNQATMQPGQQFSDAQTSQQVNQNSAQSSQQFNQVTQAFDKSTNQNSQQYNQSNQSSPYSQSTNQTSQYNQSSNQTSPYSQSSSQASPYSHSANQSSPYSQSSNQSSQYNQSTNQPPQFNNLPNQTSQQFNTTSQIYNQSPSQTSKQSHQSPYNQNNLNSQQFNQSSQSQFIQKNIQASQYSQQSYSQTSQSPQHYSQQTAQSPQHFSQPVQSPQQFSQPVQSPQQFQQQPSQSPQQYSQHLVQSPQHFNQPTVPSPQQYQQPAASPQQFNQPPAPSSQQYQQTAASPQQFNQPPAPSSQQYQSTAPSPQQFFQQSTASPQQFSQHPTPSPQHLSQQPAPSPQQFSQPAPSPQQFSQPAPSPQQFSQPAPSPQQFSQTVPSPQQFPQTNSSPQQYSQPTPSPQQFSQPVPSPQQFSQHTSQQFTPPTPPSQQYSQPAPSPQQFPQLTPSPQQFSQPAPSPQHFVQTNQSPQQYSQPAPSPQSFSQQTTPSQSNPPTQQFSSMSSSSQQLNQQTSQTNQQIQYVQQTQSQHFSQPSSHTPANSQYSQLSQSQYKSQSGQFSQYSVQQPCISATQTQQYSNSFTHQPSSKGPFQADYQNQTNVSISSQGLSNQIVNQQSNKQTSKGCKNKQSRLKSVGQVLPSQTSQQSNLKQPPSFSVQAFQNGNPSSALHRNAGQQSVKSLQDSGNTLLQLPNTSTSNQESFALQHISHDSNNTFSGKCPKAILQTVKHQNQDQSLQSQTNSDVLQSESDIKSVSNINDSAIIPFRDRMDSSINYEWAIPIMKDYILGVLENSHKMMVLFVIIAETLQMGDKLLVFSQSLSTLDLLEQFLNKIQVPRKPDQPEQMVTETWSRNKNYFRLDGSTSAQEREKLINEFNRNDNVSLFLLSTRAGCLGINLVGANRIVVMDASWNPCHDAQAVCRIYRYGQKKQCYIYRLVTDNSLEKRIYDRQVNKQGMSDRVVDELNPESNFTWKDVTTLIQDDEDDGPVQELSKFASSYTDKVLKYLVSEMSPSLSKEPFEHESLLLDRKDLKLTKQEKRLAKQSYEMAKRANMINIRTTYTYLPAGTASGGQFIINNKQCQWVGGTTIRVLPNQNNAGAGNARSGTTATPITASPTLMSSLFKQGVMVQKLTMPSNVSIPVLTPGAPPVVIPAGQDVLVLRTPKGVYLRLPDGRIIAVQLPPSLLAKTQFRPNVVTHFRPATPKGGNHSTTVINTPRGQSIGIVKQTLQCGGTVRYLGPRNAAGSSGHNSSRGSAPEVIDLSDDEEPSLRKHGIASNASANSSESESGSGDMEKPERQPTIFPGKHITIRKISPNSSGSVSKEKCEIPQVLSKNKQITILPINPSAQQSRQKFAPQLAQPVRVQQMLLQPQQGKRKPVQKNPTKVQISPLLPGKSVRPQIVVSQPTSSNSNFQLQKIRHSSSILPSKNADVSEKNNELNTISIKSNSESPSAKIPERSSKTSPVILPQTLQINKNSSITVSESGKNHSSILPPSLAALAVNPNLQITPASRTDTSLSDSGSQKSGFSTKSLGQNSSTASFLQNDNFQNNHSIKSSLQITPTSCPETSDSHLLKAAQHSKTPNQNMPSTSGTLMEQNNIVSSNKHVLPISSSSESTTASDTLSSRTLFYSKSFIQNTSGRQAEQNSNVVQSLNHNLQITPVPHSEPASISDLFSQQRPAIHNSSSTDHDVHSTNSAKSSHLFNKMEISSLQVSIPQTISNKSSTLTISDSSSTVSTASSLSSASQVSTKQLQSSTHSSFQQILSTLTNSEAKQKQQTMSYSSQSLPNMQVSLTPTVSSVPVPQSQHSTSRKRKSSNKQPSKKSQQQHLIMSQNHVLQSQTIEASQPFLHPQISDHLLSENHFPTFPHHISGTDFTTFSNFSSHKTAAHIQHPQPLHPLQHSQEHSLLPHLQHMSHLYPIPPHLAGTSSLPDTQPPAPRAWPVPQPSVSSFHPFSQSSPFFSSGQESNQLSFPSSFPLPPSTLTSSLTQSDSNSNIVSVNEKSSRISTSNM